MRNKDNVYSCMFVLITYLYRVVLYAHPGVRVSNVPMYDEMYYYYYT